MGATTTCLSTTLLPWLKERGFNFQHSNRRIVGVGEGRLRIAGIGMLAIQIGSKQFLALVAIRSTPHSRTGFSPAEIVLGFQPLVPMETQLVRRAETLELPNMSKIAFAISMSLTDANGKVSIEAQRETGAETDRHVFTCADI